MTKDIIVGNFSEVDLGKIALPNYTVYYNTKDYPRKYVVRLWDANGLKATNCIVLGDCLSEVRASLPQGLTRFH